MRGGLKAGGWGLEAKGLGVPGRLEGITFDLPSGCLAAVVGPNGAGKSTLLQALAGLLPFEGEVAWQSEALSQIPTLERGRRLAWWRGATAAALVACAAGLVGTLALGGPKTAERWVAVAFMGFAVGLVPGSLFAYLCAIPSRARARAKRKLASGSATARPAG